MTEIDDTPDSDSNPAEYIATMAHELSLMASQSGMDLLGYLLEMARDEARSAALASREVDDEGDEADDEDDEGGYEPYEGYAGYEGYDPD